MYAFFPHSPCSIDSCSDCHEPLTSVYATLLKSSSEDKADWRRGSARPLSVRYPAGSDTWVGSGGAPGISAGVRRIATPQLSREYEGYSRGRPSGNKMR